MTSTRAIPLLSLWLAAGCASSHVTDPDAPSAMPDAGSTSSDCAGGLTWIDRGPIVRVRTRFVTPVVTGDEDGFLFATTARVPDSCEDGRCVLVERFPSTGEAPGLFLVSYTLRNSPSFGGVTERLKALPLIRV